MDELASHGQLGPKYCKWVPVAVIALRGMLTTTGGRALCAIMLSATFINPAIAQQVAAPASQPGAISGTVTDINDGIVPGAEVILHSPLTGEKRTVVSGNDGSYSFTNLRPGVSYYITIIAAGFLTWTSPAILVSSGQRQVLTESKIPFAREVASVTVYASSEEIAAEQVKIEERQRVLGIIPNFYVSYDHNAVPLTKKLKFSLALRAGTDPMIFAAVAFAAGAEQAGDTPDYGQGAKGFGQRMGSLYASGFADIMLGEAILPSLLHQDPRYFYQGTGTTRSRVFHALSSAFICKGDNGNWEPNYSNIGGDLAAGAISNIYYPQANRGAKIVFENALISGGGRMVNGIVQEFVLRRFTPSAKSRTR
jgi:Carboxypeptidase regulatory-like domain